MYLEDRIAFYKFTLLIEQIKKLFSNDVSQYAAKDVLIDEIIQT